MNRELMARQMFAGGGQVYKMQEGGVPPVNPMAGMPVSPDAAMPPMAGAAGVDPAMMEQMLMQAQQNITALDDAQSAEEVMNAMRGDQASVEERRMELAQIVGEGDAQSTPESVLTLVQPVMMMAQVDQGIGALAQDQMNQPVTGDMAGGIMSTVDMGAEEGPAPVNFKYGGVVGMQEGGDPLIASYQKRLPLYQQIAGIDAAEQQRQADLDTAQILFSIAKGGLQLASPTDRKMSTAEKLAMAGQGVLQDISGIASEASKRKAAERATMQQAKFSALQAAETEAATLGKRKEVNIDGQVIDITDPRNPFVIFGDKKRNLQTIGGQIIDVTDSKNPRVVYGSPDTKTVTIKDQVIDITDPKNPFVVFGDKSRELMSINGQIIDVTDSKNPTVVFGSPDTKTVSLNGQVYDITDPKNPFVIVGDKNRDIKEINGQLVDVTNPEKPFVIFGEPTRKQQVVNGQIIDITDPKNPFVVFGNIDKDIKTVDGQLVDVTDPGNPKVIFGDKTKDWKVVDGKLYEIVDGQPVLRVDKDQAGSDAFSKGDIGRAQAFLAGPGAADLAKRYAEGKTLPEEDNQIDLFVSFYTNPQRVFDIGIGDFVTVDGHKLPAMWKEAISQRKSNVPGASVPAVNRSSSGTVVDGTGGGDPREVKIVGATYEELVRGIEDPTYISGRASVAAKVLNKGSEILTGGLLFDNIDETQRIVGSMNTGAISSLVGNVPGKESEQFRQELKAVLPDVAAFTVGSQSSLTQLKGAVAYFNQEISALNAKARSPNPPASIGEIRYGLNSLAAFRDFYNKLARKLEAELNRGRANRPPLNRFMKNKPEYNEGAD